MKKCIFFDKKNIAGVCRMKGSGIDKEMCDKFCEKDGMKNCPVYEFYLAEYNRAKIKK